MGFFPEGDDLQDTAVLAVTSFEVEGEAVFEFAEVGRDFLNNATAKNKKNLIIDLSGNGGGSVFAGLNLFRMLFPKEEIYSATRFRANEATDLIGKLLNKLPADKVAGDLYDWRSQVKPDQKEGFDSSDDFHGPYKALGVNSSALMAAANFTLIAEEDVSFSGFGGQKLDPAEAAFEPGNIIMLTDGYCASTCTVFAELMKKKGVQSIAFGGRPQNGPMQAIGGVKGSQVLEFESFSETFLARYEEVLKNGSLLTPEQLEDWHQVVPPKIKELSFNVLAGSVNQLNAFGPSNDHLPRQFIYEAAECRRFYTYDNYLHQNTTWASAADAMFNGGGCVPGSTDATGSLFAQKATSRQSLLAVLLEYSSS